MPAAWEYTQEWRVDPSGNWTESFPDKMPFLWNKLPQSSDLLLSVVTVKTTSIPMALATAKLLFTYLIFII